MGEGQLRTSPLLAEAGEATLSPGECRRVHSAIAERLFTRGSIGVTDADAMLHHAIASGDPRFVMSFAQAVRRPA